MRYLGEKLKDLSETPEEKAEKEKWARKARSDSEKRARVNKETAALEIELTEVVDRLIIDLPKKLEECAKRGLRSESFKLCKIYNYDTFTSTNHPILHGPAIQRLHSFCRYSDLHCSINNGYFGSDSKGDYTTLCATISWGIPKRLFTKRGPKRDWDFS